MNNTPSKKKRYFGLVVYGVVLTLVLLYYRFPADALRTYLETSANRTNPRLGVSLGNASPTPAFGFKVQTARVYLKENPGQDLLQTTRLLIRPNLWSWLRGKHRFTFTCESGGGIITGSIGLDDTAKSRPLDLSLQFVSVPIEEFMDLPAILGRKIEGILGGALSYNGTYGSVTAGTGQADLRISDGKAEFHQPLLGLNAIQFDEVLVQLTIRNQNLNLTRVELFGPDLQGTLSGNISLRDHFAKSRLNLRGTAEPFATLFNRSDADPGNIAFLKQRLRRGRISFIVTGTLAKPKLKFI